MKIRILIVLFSLLLFFCFPSFSYAEENFSFNADVTYTISENDMTHVVLNMSLTNKTSKYYTAENTIRLGFDTIEHIKASDPQGAIVPEVSKDEKGYTIKTRFNEPAVGINKTLPFTVEFDTPDVVQQQGNIYEVDIPGLGNQNDYESFTVHVRVPDSFGPPQYIKPDVGSKTLDFTKEQLGRGGISIAFGENQMYAFSLRYHLRNTHVFPIRTEIALPPDTNYQQVAIETMDPPPLEVKKDADGNWLATYSLLPATKKDILVKGKIKLNLLPKEQVETDDQLARYLQPQPYWETTNSEIQEVAKTLTTPRAIYEYVSKKLSYDFSRVTEKQTRLGAAALLKDSRSAVCLEFTDLFIALARAAGIPAREVDGFGYTKNAIHRPLSLQDDILHAWPEYYDKEKKTWIMVDPTWGNTTGGVDYFDVLDFSHIAFVIKGRDSSYPIPAGGYKASGEKANKDVTIVPIADTSFPIPYAMATVDIPKQYIAGIPVSGVIRVINPKGVAYPSQKIALTSQQLFPDSQQITVSEILPFGYADVPFAFDSTNILFYKHATITAQIGSSTVSQRTSIIPFYAAIFQQPLLPWTIGGGVVFASITIIIWLIATRSRNISVS